MMLRCVSTAPLDSPVVPPVYCRKALESSVAWLGVSVRPAPWANAALKRVSFWPSDSGSAKAGTILARWRTAKVIQAP